MSDRQMRLLIVEDEKDFREVFLEFLESEFAESKLAIDVAVNGQDALEKIALKDYDLMISDVRMPVMDGLELVKRLRALENFIEIIIFSGHGCEEEDDIFRECGVEQLVKKPQFPELIEHLRSTLNLA